MMKSIFALILVLVLALTASAATETVKFGPYTAAFDLNTTGKYSIDVIEPSIGDDVQMEPGRWNKLDIYSFDIVNEDLSRARVSVLGWKNYSDATISKDIEVEGLTMRVAGIRNVSSQFVQVQGKTGYLMVGRAARPISIAWYWLDKVDVPNSVVSYGRQRVRIAGNMTAEQSISLLQTINVVKS